MKFSVERILDLFSNTVLDDVPAIQRSEMRKAFVAGFDACLMMVYRLADLPEDDAVKVLDSIDGELKELIDKYCFKIN